MESVIAKKKEMEHERISNDIRENKHRETGIAPHWHWQERGTAWKGIGIYHVTLTIPSREPILGRLVIPDNDPTKAYVQETPLAKQVVSCLLHLYEFYPEVLILQFCVMPDHIHAVIHIRRPIQDPPSRAICPSACAKCVGRRCRAARR